MSKIKNGSHTNRGEKIETTGPSVVAYAGNSEHIVFSFKFVVKDYCIERCERDDQLAFIKKMMKLSGLTWRELSFGDHHGLAYEKIKAVKVPLPLSVKNKNGLKLIAFRFSGKKPMVGYREGCIFYVIFFDRDMNIYKH